MMFQTAGPAWEYKIVIQRPDGSISLDHCVAAEPLYRLLDELQGQGWSLVHDNEAPGPTGVQVTYTLRRPAPTAGESAPETSS